MLKFCYNSSGNSNSAMLSLKGCFWRIRGRPKGPKLLKNIQFYNTSMFLEVQNCRIGIFLF